jgi:Domain of unknown function (DUF4160)
VAIVACHERLWGQGYRRIRGSAPARSRTWIYRLGEAAQTNKASPPHFHARYGEYEAQVIIHTGEPMAGQMPIRALRLIREWAGLHQAELRDNWERAQSRMPLASIDPLP